MSTTEATVDKPPNPIAVRPFRLLWLNNVCFFLVSNAQRFVFGWLVLDGLNRSESDQGIAVFTLGLPSALLVLQAGVWADRWDRRTMLITTQVAGGVVMAAVANALLNPANSGDVMKESAQIALNYVRSHADELGLDAEAAAA